MYLRSVSVFLFTNGKIFTIWRNISTNSIINSRAPFTNCHNILTNSHLINSKVAISKGKSTNIPIIRENELQMGPMKSKITICGLENTLICVKMVKKMGFMTLGKEEFASKRAYLSDD